MMSREERESLYNLIVKEQKAFEKVSLQEDKAKPFARKFFENMNKLLKDDYELKEVEVNIGTLTFHDITNAIEGFSYRLASICESSMNGEPVKKERIETLAEEVKEFVDEVEPPPCHYEIDESERGVKLSYAQQFNDPSYLWG